MNTLDYYYRQKEAWDEKELNEIKVEYEEKEKTISEIADTYRRTPGCIYYRLKKLGIIKDTRLARGYEEYIKSNLYREIIEKSKIKDAKNNINNNLEKGVEERVEIKKLIKIKKNNQIGIQDSYKELKNEINNLKNDVQEILRLMNAIYEFETQ